MTFEEEYELVQQEPCATVQIATPHGNFDTKVYPQYPEGRALMALIQERKLSCRELGAHLNCSPLVFWRLKAGRYHCNTPKLMEAIRAFVPDR